MSFLRFFRALEGPAPGAAASTNQAVVGGKPVMEISRRSFQLKGKPKWSLALQCRNSFEQLYIIYKLTKPYLSIICRGIYKHVYAIHPCF